MKELPYFNSGDEKIPDSRFTLQFYIALRTKCESVMSSAYNYGKVGGNHYSFWNFDKTIFA